MFIDKEVNLVADIVTGNQIAELAQKLTGNVFNYRPVPALMQRFRTPEVFRLRHFFSQFSKPEYQQKLTTYNNRLHQFLPEVMTIADYLKASMTDFGS